jgi:hypothetical protein
MGLLDPLLLALGAAAAVPLMLHLLQRHQGPRIRFPALRYLRRAEKESARRVRLRQVMLMMVRVAAVLLIAFAAARPFVRAAGAAGAAGAGHAPTAVVIVLDNSMSTALVAGGDRVLDGLRARALAVLEAAGPDDRFWLLRAGEPGEPALAGDAEVTAMRIRAVVPAATNADIPAALQRAHALLAAGAGGRAREIHLLTDLQAGSFAAPAAAPAGAPPVMVYHPRGDAPPNRAIVSIEVGGGMAPVAGRRTTVAAAVAGAGIEPVTVRLLIDGRLSAAATAVPGMSAVLPLPALPAGIVTGRVELDPDALHLDDARYFTARIVPPPAVAIAGEQPFLRAALAVLVEAGRARYAAGMADADVAFLPAGGNIEALAARTAAVVLPPATPEQLAAANRRIATAGIPWRYGPPPAGETRFDLTGAGPLDRALAGVRLQRTWPLAADGAGPGDSVLLRLTDGTPWAVRGERRAGGVYILLGSTLDTAASTLPTGIAMLPLLDQLTGAWSAAGPPPGEVAPGAEVRIPDGATALLLPDGRRVPVTPGTTQRLGVVPGVYSALADTAITAAWAVNPPAGASELDRLDRHRLDAMLPGWTLYVTSDPAAFMRAAFHERRGLELWRPLLLALLLVLISESVIAAAGRSRPGATTLADARTG